MIEENDLRYNREKNLISEMKNECITRLRILKLYTYVRDFYNGILNVSDVNNNAINKISEKEKQDISLIQIYNNFLIYHIIRLNDNTVLYLYVDRNKENWIKEKKALIDGFVEVLSMNKTVKTIGIETTDNVIKRVIY